MTFRKGLFSKVSGRIKETKIIEIDLPYFYNGISYA